MNNTTTSEVGDTLENINVEVVNQTNEMTGESDIISPLSESQGGKRSSNQTTEIQHDLLLPTPAASAQSLEFPPIKVTDLLPEVNPRRYFWRAKTVMVCSQIILIK